MPEPEDPPARVITVSATYGAGGSVISPRLAERLDVPFYDRLIHTSSVGSAEQIEERLTAEERKKQTPPGRVLANLSRMSTGLVLPSMDPATTDPINDLHSRVLSSVNGAAATGGVILGRGAAVVLADRPAAFHVRLSGPVARRVRRGMEIEGVPEEDARQHQVEADRAWGRFVVRVLSRDPADPDLYHLMLDSTVLPLDACVELVLAAADAFWNATSA